MTVPTPGPVPVATDLLAEVATPDGVTAGPWHTDAGGHLIRTLSDGSIQRGDGSLAEPAPPLGVNFADIWEGDTRNLYREVGTLLISTDPLRNPIVAALCEQRRDGRICAVEVSIDADTSSEGMTPDQARELAGLLTDAASQADEWAGTNTGLSPVELLANAFSALRTAHSMLKAQPGNADSYVKAALDSISDAAEVLR